MINVITNIIYFILQFSYIVPFIIMLFPLEHINLDKKVRYKQMFLPLFSMLYCFVIWKLYSNIYFGIQDILKNITGIMLPELPIYTLFNPVVVLIYCFIKKFMLYLSDNFITGEEGSLFTKINKAYQYNNEDFRWYISKNWGQAREFMKIFRYVTIIWAVLFSMLVCYLLKRGDEVQALFYPVYVVLMVNELYFFLDGYLEGEEDELEGESDNAGLIINYSLLREILKHLFGDKLVSESTSVDIAGDEIQTNDEVLTELENSGNAMLEAYGIFMRKKTEMGMKLEQSYLVSGKDLLEGKSIIFNNPFYYDLIPYIFYPMNRVLLHNKKVLIILGRHDIEKDILAWCIAGLTKVNNLPYLWKTGVLNNEEQDLDIGIVTRSCVHNLQMQKTNQDFFNNVGFVVLIEPSKLLATAQVGLSSLARHFKNNKDGIVYCSIDKNCDGLVDALSHILLTDFTEVSASRHNEGISSYMCWNADGECLQHRIIPGISRYLGMGTELGIAALKNEVPQVTWYGGSAFPVTDMHWIMKQYYYDLLKYAELPATEQMMDTVFKTEADLWNADIKPCRYIIAEDESYNMFETKRCFASRSSEQGFVNILSTEYLLKDYMAGNNGLFQADCKAIPYFAADYSNTQRNVVLRLCLRMSTGLVPGKEIEDGLKLVNVPVNNVVNDLWHMICKYSQKMMESRSGKNGREILYFSHNSEECTFNSEVICIKRKFSKTDMCMKNYYYIENEKFIQLVLEDLQSAEYVAEDEYGNHNYLGTELKGQTFQRYLPGQFFTFCGKYYEIVRQDADGKLITRRASDHIDGRKTYRQNRHYIISCIENSPLMGDDTRYNNIFIQVKYADITVKTPSYWKLDQYNDFVNCRKVELNGVPERSYYNKQVLCMDFSNYGDICQNVIITLTMLINEVFRSIFAENQGFIAAVTPCSRIIQNTYYIDDGGKKILNNNSIYIIEDSYMDIGLLQSVRRNWHRIFEIIHDYLDWHTETLNNSISLEAEPTVESTPAETNVNGNIPVHLPYYSSYYLLFGGKETPEWLDITGVQELLCNLGCDRKGLWQARKEKNLAEDIEKSIKKNEENSHYCDFCGRKLTGIFYEVLKDSRERCHICGRTAVRTEREFIEIYNKVKKNLRIFYGISISVPVQVKMVNAKRLHKAIGRTFVPGHIMSNRILGVSIFKKGKYYILAENGAPKLQAILTIVHELVHIWQYVNWDADEIKRKYGADMEDQVYEGMAEWSEVQYAYLINETASARRKESDTINRNDEYGQGFIKYAEIYPISKSTDLPEITPFAFPHKPL